jgi:hypothetical protein
MDEPDRLVCIVAGFVGRVQPFAGADENAGGDRVGQAASLGQLAKKRTQWLAVDPLHHLVEQAAFFAKVEDLHDVGMADARGQGGLVQEHLLESSVVGQRREDGLDGHDPLEASGAFEPGSPDGGHASLSHRHQKLVTAQKSAYMKLVEGLHPCRSAAAWCHIPAGSDTQNHLYPSRRPYANIPPHGEAVERRGPPVTEK